MRASFLKAGGLPLLFGPALPAPGPFSIQRMYIQTKEGENDCDQPVY
ncbi:hypothetical protein HMPREF9413_3594 [Paenibacillus sp. HGF7]|nr:hypothetical protein HMPREF9413_3594 [Paenibacillus sp. HGF7]